MRSCSEEHRTESGQYRNLVADTIKKTEGKQQERGETFLVAGEAPKAATLSGMVTQADRARQGVTHSSGDEDPQSARGWEGAGGD